MNSWIKGNPSYRMPVGAKVLPTESDMVINGKELVKWV